MHWQVLSRKVMVEGSTESLSVEAQRAVHLSDSLGIYNKIVFRSNHVFQSHYCCPPPLLLHDARAPYIAAFQWLTPGVILLLV